MDGWRLVAAARRCGDHRQPSNHIMTHHRRLVLPCALALFLLSTLWIAVYAADNLITNPGFDSDWTGWTNSGCSRSNTQCGSYMASCGVGDSFYQWITPTVSGVHRVRWMFYGDPIASHYGSLYDQNSEGMGCSWNYTPVNCNFGSWKYAGLNAGVPYKLRFTHPSYGARTDDVTLEYYRTWITHTYDSHNVVLNPGFYGGLQSWTEATGDPDYDGDLGADDQGSLELDATEVLTQMVDVSYSATYTYGLSSWCGALGHARMYVYDDGGTPLDYVQAGPCGGTSGYTWYDTVDLTPGEYEVRLIGYTDQRAVDDVFLWNGLELVDVPDFGTGPQGGGSAWIYRPLEYGADLGYYQEYSSTSAYGAPYATYNIYQTAPDAVAYSLASMEIIEVGTNFLGYYVVGQIDAWPDILSTTLRYEGLGSVSVVQGQQVGASCEIGRVANRWEFGSNTYHLLLGVWYPDDDHPIDPRGYMTRWPTEDLCQVYGDVPDAGGATIGAGGLWDPVCRQCVRPMSLLSIGDWINWLGCVFTNLITCDLVRVLNSIIGFVAGIYMTVINAVGWLAVTVGLILDWYGSLWNNVIRVGLANLLNSALNALLNSEPVYWIWSSRKIMANLWSVGRLFIKAVFLWFNMAWLRFESMFTLVQEFVVAIKGIFNVQAVDLLDIYGFGETGGGAGTGLPQLDGAGGVLQTLLNTPGSNLAKVAWLIFFGVYYLDYQISDQNVVFTVITYMIYAITAWSVIWWTVNQFEDAAEEST